MLSMAYLPRLSPISVPILKLQYNGIKTETENWSQLNSLKGYEYFL